MKKVTAFTFALLMALSSFTTFSVGAQDFDYVKTTSIAGFDTKKITKGVFVYKAVEKDRVLYVKDYSFKNASLLIVNEEGRVIQAGSAIYDGGPQASVTIPKGGFLIAAISESVISSAQSYVMEGAMLYNSTMTVILPMYADLDEENNKLYIKYNKKPTPTDKAISVMFVGNSTTYYSGTPILFKGLCQGAGIELDVTYCTDGSAYLSEFADPNHTRGIKFRNLIKKKKYDYVVFQDAGHATKQSTDAALSVLIPYVTESGAKPIMYLRYSSSGTVSWEELLYYTKGYYDIYSEMSEKYNMKMLPSGISFLYCFREHPEIKLYADDNVHHSKEAAYMLASAWLYSLFGKSPVNNPFTAYIPEDTVNALWNCAVKAVDEGWDFENKPTPKITEKEIDGKLYEDFAFGKKYTTTGNRYESQKWEDIGANGQLYYKLTDGIMSDVGDDANIGAVSGLETEIVIDLEEIKAIKQIEADIWGNTGWGISDPDNARIKVSLSKDGRIYSDFDGQTDYNKQTVGTYWNKGYFTIKSDNVQKARYIKLTVTLGSKFRWMSEILVYGEDTEYDEMSDEWSENNSDELPNEENSYSGVAEEISEASRPQSEKINNESTSISPFVILGGAIALAAMGAWLYFSRKSNQ